jgi:hypothetical protein
MSPIFTASCASTVPETSAAANVLMPPIMDRLSIVTSPAFVVLKGRQPNARRRMMEAPPPSRISPALSVLASAVRPRLDTMRQGRDIDAG